MNFTKKVFLMRLFYIALFLLYVGLAASPSFAVSLTENLAESTSATGDFDGDGVLNPSDVDDDNDGLIEIRTLSELNAMRYNTSGTGLKLTPTATMNREGSPGLLVGYELLCDLDMDTDGDGSTHQNGSGDPDDLFFNEGNGWEPMGIPYDGSDMLTFGKEFSANFEGNGHIIKNFFINRPDQNHVGFFACTARKRIRNIAFLDVWVKGGDYTGSISGESQLVGTLNNGGYSGNIWVSGRVSGKNKTGGIFGSLTNQSHNLVGILSQVDVTGNERTGGVMGEMGARVQEVISTGGVSGGNERGGMAGWRDMDRSETWGANVSYYDQTQSGQTDLLQGASPKTTRELQEQTSFQGIYILWDSNLWDLGDDTSYPTLSSFKR